jgi:hypothetical protein
MLLPGLAAFIWWGDFCVCPHSILAVWLLFADLGGQERLSGVYSGLSSASEGVSEGQDSTFCYGSRHCI